MPWWGWLLVALWCGAGAAAFIVSLLYQAESPISLVYWLVDAGDRFRLGRFALKLAVSTLTLALHLPLGPLGLVAVIVAERERKRREHLREERRQQRIARRVTERRTPDE